MCHCINCAQAACVHKSNKKISANLNGNSKQVRQKKEGPRLPFKENWSTPTTNNYN